MSSQVNNDVAKDYRGTVPMGGVNPMTDAGGSLMMNGRAVDVKKGSKGCSSKVKDTVALIIGIVVGIAVAIGIGFLTFGVGSPFLLSGYAVASGAALTGCAGAIMGMIFGVGSRAIMDCSSKKKA